MTRFLILVFCALNLSGCAYFFAKPPAEIEAETSLVYRVGPGDQINVSVWRNDALNQSVTVRPDGYISIPLIGDVKAAGLTPPELAENIEEELSSIIQEPNVTVNLATVGARADSSIRVVGEAIEPRLVPYFEGITVIDVITAAGGLTEFADGNRAYLVRYKDGKRQRYRVRLSSLIKAGDMRVNVDLAPGDILVVPERWY